ncbi:MAG: TIGR00366 family protein [Acidobacteriota bacterium]|nr:TIGR00366 family protein [Acidobacteriota bacterium]
MTQESWADRFARVMGRFVPDAITAAIFLLVGLFAAAVAVGNSFSTTMDAWYRGLWMLLPFTMQMTLIITLSSVVGQTPGFKKMVAALSGLPKTTNQVVIVAVLLNAALSYFYWGLGVALGPIIAIYFAREAERKKIEVDFLFLLALVWAANAVWQFGLSASAPLLMATPGHFMESTIGVVSLRTTIWSPAAIIHEIAYIIALIACGCWLMPKARRPLSAFPEANKLGGAEEVADAPAENFAERLERNYVVTLVFCLALAAWIYYHFGVKKLGLDINSLNAIFLLLSFLLHRNVYRFTKALQHAITSAWPVIVIYHLYAGVAGLIQFTTIGEKLAGMIAAVSTPYTFPLLAAVSGTLASFFIPSSGGQWAIQGFVTSKAAMAVGVTVQRGMLALSIGDHMGNLTTPFWAMIVAGIARVNFREFIGYGMIFAALWFVIGVIVFTFAPC